MVDAALWASLGAASWCCNVAAMVVSFLVFRYLLSRHAVTARLPVAYELPARVRRAKPARTVGPFSGADIPAALKKAHSVKKGSWGRLSLLRGRVALHFPPHGALPELRVVGKAPDVLGIPPERPHNLELVPGDTWDDVELKVDLISA